MELAEEQRTMIFYESPYRLVKILEQFAEISSNAKHDYSVNVILQAIAPELPRGTDIYLITPFVDDKMAGLLHALRHTGRNVEVILLSGGRHK